MIDSTWRRLRRIFSSAPADVDDELAFHEQMRIDEFMKAGKSREEAEVVARQRFGERVSVRSTLVGIDARRRRRRDWRDRFDSVAQDVVVSLRALRREPMFTAGVVLTIAIGIGANATMFGIIDGLMLRGPSHVVDAGSLQRLYITSQQPGFGASTVSYAGYITYTTLRDNAKSFRGVAAYNSPYEAKFGEAGSDRTVQQASATWDYFTVLGVRPLIGRFYGADEDSPAHTANVAVISEDFWRATLGADPSILGKPITMNGERYTVIGVTPSGFGGTDRSRTDVWLPMSLVHPTTDWPTTYNAQWLRVVARLAPGASPQQASAEVTALLRAAYKGPRSYMRQLTADVRPIWYGPRGETSPTVNIARWLMGVAVIVLLVTCANVANLLIARARRRRREVAVRLALGAGRARLVRLLTIETMLVVLGGAVAALAIAAAGSRIMRVTLLSQIVWDRGGVDVRVFTFTLVLALIVGLVLGLLPALGATRTSLTQSLKAGAGDGGGQRAGLRVALSAAQAALCVILLAGAGLFVRSLQKSRTLDLGFQPSRLLRANIDFTLHGLKGAEREAAKERNRETLASAVERLERLPWVEHAALSVGSPLGNGFGVTVRLPNGDSLPKAGGEDPRITAASAGYFATAGTPLRAGRVFTPADRAGSTPVAIVNEFMARTLWPNESAIGKCLIIGDPRPNQPPPACAEIVGIVGDVHLNGLRDKPSMQYYIPFGQEVGFGGTSLLVRSRGTADESLGALKKAFLAMPDVPDPSVQSVQAVLDPEFRPWQLGAALFGVFGIVALIVAAVGLYSVIAYLVADRTRELGVRIALGASAGRVTRDVIRGGATVAAIGVAIGVVLALGAGKFVEPMLFNVSAHDPVVLSSVAAIVLLIAVFAAWIPARRASRVDPVVALRAE